MCRSVWICVMAMAGLSGLASSSQAQVLPYGVHFHSRPLSVTDPYGVPFHTWIAPPIGYGTSIYSTYGNFPSQSTLGAGFGWGGQPLVASATTSEWIVQRTSVFPLYPYVSWGIAPGPPGWWLGSMNPASTIAQTGRSRRRRENAVELAGFQSTNRLGDRTAEATRPRRSLLATQRAQAWQDDGDRLLREEQVAKAYVRYLESQREAPDRAEIYFREAIALTALGRFAFAVTKFKRGIQLDPDWARSGLTLEELFGRDRHDQRIETLRRATEWASADPDDPDRQLLIELLHHFDAEPLTAAEVSN